MDHVTDLFDDATQTDPVSDLDVDIAHAGHVLTKLADEAGIDLDKLSDADVAELVSDLLPEPKTSADKTTEEPETTRKEAHTMADADKTTPETITHADVAVELSKIASANGVDLATVSREEYHAAYDALAEKMASPSYEQDKKAAEEMYKASYDQGVAMAEGFIDRLKQAEHDEKKDEKEEKKEPPKKDDEEHKEAAAGFMSHLKETAKKHMGKAHEAAGAAKHKATEGGKKLMEHLKGHKHEYAAGAAGAGAGAAAGAAGMHHHKKALDEAALAVAQQVLRDNGIDPETGNKLAAEEPAAEFTEDDVAQRAAEMLKEAGYQLPE